MTQSEFGGAQRFIYRLVTNLDLNKYDILIATGPEGNDANGLLFNLQKEGFNTFSLKFLRRKINPIFDLLGLFEIKKLLKQESPDILFLCSSKAGLLGSLAHEVNSKFKIQNSKLIYRIGGWTFNDPWPNWKRKLYLWLEKQTAKFKDIIINNAESDRQQAIKLGIKPRQEILTIYNGLDADKIDFLEKKEAKEFLQFKDTDFVVGTIANDYPAKGLDYFNKAVKGFTNIKSIIIGKGNRFIPDAYKYLKAFDIFILPSVKEGFPWTILEAMAAEVSIIAAKVGAIPEIIQNNRTGILVEPRNSQQISEAIKKLIGDKNLRESLAKEAKKIVIEKFNLKTMVKKYEDLFSVN